MKNMTDRHGWAHKVHCFHSSAKNLVESMSGERIKEHDSAFCSSQTFVMFWAGMLLCWSQTLQKTLINSFFELCGNLLERGLKY
jgi:hypothetical protein